jgi:hypothetical protein
MDFWGSIVLYTPRVDDFELRSFGPDRKAATSDDLVISYQSDRAVARRLTGCYRPVEGWWTSSPTTVRLDTIPGTLLTYLGSYALQAQFPRRPQIGQEWFPIGTDSLSVQWGEGTMVRSIRLKIRGDTLVGRTDFEDLDWRGVLKVVRTRCEV